MNVPASDQDVRPRLFLLVGQALALGTTSSLLVITANALFLPAFGSQALPYVYILVALLGSLLSYGSAALQRHFTVPQIALAIIGGLTIFFFFAWLLAAQAWVSFALIACFPLLLQLGFMFLGGQAGRLFDVRQIKRLFPQIVAGFVAGFMLGAFLAPLLLGFLGRTENLILPVSLSALVFFILIFVTHRRYRAVFGLAAGPGQARRGKSLPQLLRGRFVLLIFGYQVLYAVVNQLSDFLLLVQTGVRYSNSADIANFFSTFTVVLNGVGLFVLLVIAGVFLSRFGLSAGLAANPLLTVLIYGAAAAAGVVLGPASDAFFILIVVGRIVNITAANGSTRGSVNAVYQALPPHDQALVQTGAEGIGQPLALGLVGAALLAFNVLKFSALQVTFITIALAALWGAVGLWVYRGYSGALLRSIKRRVLGPAELTLNDASSLAAVLGLAHSDNVADVRLALELLAANQHPALDDQLVRLLHHPNSAIRVEAARRIEQVPLADARPLVENMLQTDPDPAPRAAALRALCALSEAEAVERVRPYLESPEAEMRLGALVGLLRYGGIPGILAAGQRLTQLAASAASADRLLVAQVIDEVGQPAFYQPLLALLRDSDPVVRQAALTAAGHLGRARLLPDVAANLSHPETRSAAMNALVAYGPTALPLIESALANPAAFDPPTPARLVRACGQIGGEAASAILVRHLQEPDPELRTLIFAALNACAFKGSGPQTTQIEQALQREAGLSLQLLTSLQAIPAEPATQALRRALQDELNLARQRLFRLLAFLYDQEAILRAARAATTGAQLRTAQGANQALALEMLDVTLTAAHKALVFPLINPKLSAAQQTQPLAKALTRPPEAGGDGRLDGLLQAMIANSDGRWQQRWTRACAIYAAGALRLAGCRPAIQAALAEPEPVLQETARWALQALA